MGVLFIFLSAGSFLLYQGVSGVGSDKVSVMEGDSVTLHTGVQKNQQDRIKWYFNDIRIAQINGDPSKTCTDVQCKDGDERFRDRLKLDHQTGSLTITNTKTSDAGLYKLLITSGGSDSEKIFSVTVHERVSVSVSVMEGDSVTLNTGVEKKQEDRMKWYFNDIRIAQINGDPSKTCTDVQCKEGTERFRGRLKLDHQTGSLTITNIRNTDAGEYKLLITSGGSDCEKIFSVAVRGVSAAERDKMKRKVKEGESVILDPGVDGDSMVWYFNEIPIAEITGDQSKICTDVQCDERFRDRLKLDHQTGSLTIMNTRNTDSGVYQLRIITRSTINTNNFIIAVYDFPVVEVDGIKRKSVKEGGSVTLDTYVIKNSNDSMTWYFNDTIIAEITRDHNKICTVNQCDERFRDRLKLDHQTGSLTITNTTNTDDGLYKLQIIISRISIIRSFSVNVTTVPDSSVSSNAKGGIYAAAAAVVVLLVAVTAGVFYSRHRKYTQAGQNGTMMQNNHEEKNGVDDSVPLSEWDSSNRC